MADEKRMRSEPSPTRSRTRGQRTATGPMPVMISRSGRCPWRTSRWRPSSVSLSAWHAEQGCNLGLDGLRQQRSRAVAQNLGQRIGKTSWPGKSWKTLVSVTAYHSFGGEVEASSTPTIRRLTPSCRHQLSPIARLEPPAEGFTCCSPPTPPTPSTSSSSPRTRPWPPLA